MHRKLVAALLALYATTVAAFPTELEVSAGSSQVSAAAESDGRMAIVRVTNLESFAVVCSAVFRNGPETGRARPTTISPGDAGTLTWVPRRQVVRLRVELRCEPA